MYNLYFLIIVFSIMKKLIAVFVLLFVIKCINAQPKKFDNILYGVAYYHEYMPYERLDKDIQMMKDAGITVVTLNKIFIQENNKH